MRGGAGAGLLAGTGVGTGAGAPDSEEHRIDALPIKIPPANRRCLDSNNGAKKSFDDQSPYLELGQRSQPPHQHAGTDHQHVRRVINTSGWGSGVTCLHVTIPCSLFHLRYCI